MRHIAQQQSPNLISNCPKPLIIPIPRIRAPAADDHPRPEIQRLLLEAIVINVPRLRIHLVRQALEVDRGGADLLPAGGVVAVGEVAAGGEIEAHDAVVGVEDGGVGGEIGRGAAVGLDIDAPFGRVEAVGDQGAGLGEVFDLVDEFVAAVVAVAGHALGVFVGEGAAQGFDDGEGGEVFGGDELDAAALAALLLLDEVVDVGVDNGKRGVAPLRDWIHFRGGGNGIGIGEREGEEKRVKSGEVERLRFAYKVDAVAV